MPPRALYHSVTHGIRVTVQPTFLREHSRPHAGQYVFGYRVRIENVGDLAAQLISRRWEIHDSAGDDTEVEGEGVVGEQPLLHPGRVHEYRSFCVLRSPRGSMVGEYRFVRPDGTPFTAAIPRFELVIEGEPPPVA